MNKWKHVNKGRPSFALEIRHWDYLQQDWGEWNRIRGQDLYKFGMTPKEWKASCKRWIEVGGLYDCRIVREAATWRIRTHPDPSNSPRFIGRMTTP